MKDKQVANEIKLLALEAISNAGSGHSGAVMSSGDILYTLYTRHLVTDNTKDMCRDRFVMSNGHGSALLYSMLAGFDYFDMDELRGFRQYGRKLTGHPEIEVSGVEANTGPLGQGVANAVGMALAETIMNERFGLEHYTYCLAGDGCLEEGVALEALSVAGLYNLNRFILLYDKNDVTLDGKLSMSSTDNMVKKFKSMNFNVIECNGHNITKLDKAISRAKVSKDRPTVIICHTIIGKDTMLANSHKSHGKAFSREELVEIAKELKIYKPYLNLSSEVKEFLVEKKELLAQQLKQRKEIFNSLDRNRKEYQKYLKNDYNLKIKQYKGAQSTRVANNLVLNELASKVPNLVCLSADLSSSTMVKINEGGNYSIHNRLGSNIAVGIREHAMGAIANGIALHGGLNVICSTFLTFSNYMLPAIRMASMMNLGVIFAFSHSSIYDTRDGITHLPVEQLDQLRLIPNMTVWRPADYNECVAGYKWYFENIRPMCMVLSRCNLPSLPNNELSVKGAYYIDGSSAKINLIASGSEVRIAKEVRDMLYHANIKANVVSVPSIEVFESQNSQYRRKIMNKQNFVIESSTCVKYYKYAPSENVFANSTFGVTGGEEELIKHFGYDAEDIAKKIIKILNKI